MNAVFFVQIAPTALLIGGVAGICICAIGRRLPTWGRAAVAALSVLSLLLWWTSITHGPRIGGLGMPWNVPPATLEVRGGMFGHQVGTPDPRERPCQSEEELRADGILHTGVRLTGSLTPVGRTAGWLGGPEVYVKLAEDSRVKWVFVEVQRGCFLTYPPWI